MPISARSQSNDDECNLTLIFVILYFFLTDNELAAQRKHDTQEIGRLAREADERTAREAAREKERARDRERAVERERITLEERDRALADGKCCIHYITAMRERVLIRCTHARTHNYTYSHTHPHSPDYIFDETTERNRQLRAHELQLLTHHSHTLHTCKV